MTNFSIPRGYQHDHATECHIPLAATHAHCASATDADPRAFFVVARPGSHTHLAPTLADAAETCEALYGEGRIVERGERSYWVVEKLKESRSFPRPTPENPSPEPIVSWQIEGVGPHRRARGPYATYQDAARACHQIHGGVGLVETSDPEVFWWAVAEIIPPSGNPQR